MLSFVAFAGCLPSKSFSGNRPLKRTTQRATKTMLKTELDGKASQSLSHTQTHKQRAKIRKMWKVQPFEQKTAEAENFTYFIANFELFG